MEQGLPTNTSKGSSGVISVRGFIDGKQLNNGGKKVKARLRAHGFEEPYLENFPKASPTCGGGSWRMLCIISCMKSWRPGMIDIITAVLTCSDHRRHKRPSTHCGNSRRLSTGWPTPAHKVIQAGSRSIAVIGRTEVGGRLPFLCSTARKDWCLCTSTTSFTVAEIPSSECYKEYGTHSQWVRRTEALSCTSDFQ